MIRQFLLIPLLCCFIAGSTIHAQGLNLAGLDEPAPIAVQAEPVPVPDAILEQGMQESPSPVRPKMTLWALIQHSGIIGYIIILLSLIAVALMIEYALSIRRTILMPPNFADDVLKLLTQGQPNAALQKCQNDPSALAQVLHAGMTQYEFGWDAVERSAEEATAEQASRLYRKVEYLNMIGNIAPMLGLLGTVVGMVIAFQEMAEAEGYGRAADLARGIYLALITTIQGLLVAIPCLAAHSLFSNRIATLIGETTFVAEQVLQPIKKNLLRKRN
ncbi:MAG: MotA/TolQ/ExbB proton channel family protein [Planctomycetaceae bacterium]|nr:MotA/TolQ/ExbB proton channel family protein [Planctomycetaceae bacterium]